MQIIAGVLPPSTGRVTANGRNPALLARGEDYDPDAWLKHPMVQRAASG